MKTKQDYNELRLYANEIMRQLYEAGEYKQLAILQAYAKRCVELIAEENQKGKRRHACLPSVDKRRPRLNT